MKEIIWETSNTDRICEESWMYIKKKIVNLDEIDDKSMVNVIIDGKRYKFKNAGNQRLSGMYRVAHYFKSIRKFKYRYDHHKEAIVIDSHPREMGSKAIAEQTGSYEQPEYKAKVDLLLNKVVTYTDTELKSRILVNLKEFKIFTEADLQVHVCQHLVYIMKQSDIDSWKIRCNPAFYKGKKPDIVITYLSMPIIVFELKHKLWPKSKHFPIDKLKEDRNRLCKYINRYPTIERAYLLAIFDESPDNYDTLKRKNDSSKYRELFVNMNSLKGWKEEYYNKRRIIRMKNA